MPKYLTFRLQAKQTEQRRQIVRSALCSYTVSAVGAISLARPGKMYVYLIRVKKLPIVFDSQQRKIAGQPIAR